MNTMSAYAAFARSLQWGVSIPCYPAAFDFESYLDHIYEEGAKRAAVGTHPILDFARRFHIEYTSRRIDPKEVKKKEFYLVTRVNSNRVQAAMNSEGLVSAYATRLKASLGLADSGERSEQACVNELRTRQEEMHRRLARTGVEVTIIDERRDAMELLYHYYNHAKPVLDSFDIGTRTSADFSGGA